MEVRHAHATSFAKSDISDESVRTLIETAFYLSMQSDEGRFPRLRIISGKSDDPRLAVKFATPIELTNIPELRRLSPVAESQDFALLVTESKDRSLECLGLANIGPLGQQSSPGRPEMIKGGLLSFRIWIEGPGHLYVEDCATNIEYRAGRARFVLPALAYIPKLRKMIASVSKVLHGRSLNNIKEIPKAREYFGREFGLSRIITQMLSRILEACLELRHGGAFVILPEENSALDTYDISCKYPLESPDLGDDIANYWTTHIRATHSKQEGIEEYDKQLSNSYQSKARLLTNVDAIAHLSAADGCVVMTEFFRLLGFGGSILVSEEESNSTQTKVKLLHNQPCDIAYFLKNVGGQRHQSAARLVIKHNDVIVFVISQDGELSVFAKDDEGYVRIYRPVDPSHSPRAD